MNINIDIKYTEEAISAVGKQPSHHFSYASGIPFPQIGDHIETTTDEGLKPFKVVERIFTFGQDSLDIRLLLDLP
ncbi:hypothetical protein WCQ02_31235 [Paraburkholderia tropica]|uniref:hypothetical protein n=1 Tax=Paraburkholderia tropica TaxID=92647 RepID=UPI0030195CB2